MNANPILTELQAKQKMLSAFSELTKAVTYNFSKSEILAMFENNIKSIVSASNFALFLKEDDGWYIELNYGNKQIAQNINVKNDLIKYTITQDVRNSLGKQYNGFDYIIPIMHKEESLAYILMGGIDISDDDSINNYIHFIETLGSFVVISLENKRLFKKQLSQELVSKEMELAQEVQKMLIPEEMPVNDYMEIKALYQPHNQVGGDYYDFFSIDDNTIAICMCDVSGKGFSAGMLMANFQAQLRYLLNKYSNLQQIVDHLNYKMFHLTKGERYLTMFLGIYNYNERTLRYINAGHNPSILLNQDDIQLLNKGCTILGAFDQLPKMEEDEVYLSKNALLVCYTDGLTELVNEKGEMFGLDKLCEIVLNNHSNTASQFIENIKSSMENFKGNIPYNDDVSVLACKVY